MVRIFAAQRGGVPLLWMSLLAFLPSQAHAAWLGFRNDTSRPVMVQSLLVMDPRRPPRTGKPQQLYPREVTWDSVIQPGKRVIEIYDARRPTLLLGRTMIESAGNDLFFSLQMAPGGVIKVVPTPVPRVRPRNR